MYKLRSVQNTMACMVPRPRQICEKAEYHVYMKKHPRVGNVNLRTAAVLLLSIARNTTKSSRIACKDNSGTDEIKSADGMDENFGKKNKWIKSSFVLVCRFTLFRYRIQPDASSIQIGRMFWYPITWRNWLLPHSSRILWIRLLTIELANSEMAG